MTPRRHSACRSTFPQAKTPFAHPQITVKIIWEIISKGKGRCNIRRGFDRFRHPADRGSGSG
jgi:hypothetical protein